MPGPGAGFGLDLAAVLLVQGDEGDGHVEGVEGVPDFGGAAFEDGGFAGVFDGVGFDTVRGQDEDMIMIRPFDHPPAYDDGEKHNSEGAERVEAEAEEVAPAGFVKGREEAAGACLALPSAMAILRAASRWPWLRRTVARWRYGWG